MDDNRLVINNRLIWTISVVAYIICSTAFGAGPLSFLNRLSLYSFFAISIWCVMNRGYYNHNVCETSLLLLAFFIFLGALYTPTNKKAVFDTIYDYITMLILIICVTQYIESMRDIETIIIAFFIAGCVMALYVYSQYGSNFWTVLQENQTASRNNITRLGSGITNTNNIGMYTCFSTIIGGYLLFMTRYSKKIKMVVLVSTVFCFIVSMATGSKKALISTFVGVGVLYLCIMIYNENAVQKLKYLFLAVVSLLVLIYLIFNLPIFSGIATRFNTYLDFKSGTGNFTSEVERSFFTEEGIKVWKNHFIFGEGTFASAAHFGVYCHNNIVELLMNHGIVGCLSFYLFIFLIIVNYVKFAKQWIFCNRIFAPLAAVQLCILICSTNLVYYYERYYMLLFATGYAAMRCFYDLNKSDREEDDDEGDRILSEESVEYY